MHPMQTILILIDIYCQSNKNFFCFCHLLILFIQFTQQFVHGENFILLFGFEAADGRRFDCYHSFQNLTTFLKPRMLFKPASEVRILILTGQQRFGCL